MTNHRMLSLLLVWSALGACGGTYAGEITLLATLDAGVGVGTPRADDWHWPVLYYLTDRESSVLFEDFAIPPESPVDLKHTVSRDNEPDFNVFASLLGDGVDQDIISGAWNQNLGLLGGAGGPESYELSAIVPQFGPDLFGYTIDHVTRILTISVESPGSDPFGDGQWTDWTVTGMYEFYGTPIPEPTTLVVFLTAGTPYLLRRATR